MIDPLRLTLDLTRQIQDKDKTKDRQDGQDKSKKKTSTLKTLPLYSLLKQYFI
jgi:hypothetical protein